MPLVGDDLATAVNNAIAALSEEDKRNMEEVRKAEMNAIVDYFKANAVVSTTVVGTLPSGPVAASGTGGIT